MYEIIKKIATKQYGKRESYKVVFFNSVEIDIPNYGLFKLYSAQASNDDYSVVFTNGKIKTSLTFATQYEVKSIDRRSFEKFGGLINICEPMTQEIIDIVTPYIK
jgi:hypothetical protein